jgi:choline dehydrogenase-like flavoprotein
VFFICIWLITFGLQLLLCSLSKLEKCKLSRRPYVLIGHATYGTSDQNEDFVTVPGLAGGAIGTKYDWNTSYSANDALGGRVVPIPQGKIVGGSTKLNRMVFDRGSKSDYSAWESFGNTGWDFESLLPYFKKVCLMRLHCLDNCRESCKKRI